MLNDIPNSVISIPNSKQFLKNSAEQLFKPKFYTKCPSCAELNECPSLCVKCNTFVQKKRDEFFMYLPIESQIRTSIIEHFDYMRKQLDHLRSDTTTDAIDEEIQREMTKKYYSFDFCTPISFYLILLFSSLALQCFHYDDFPEHTLFSMFLRRKKFV